MKDVSEIKHVGMTVTDIPTMVEWYRTNFGFEVMFQTTFTAYKDGFFGEAEDSPKFYNVPEGTTCDIAMVQQPEGGPVLEFFQFQANEEREFVPWVKPGLNHIAFDTNDFTHLYERLVANNCEFAMRPGLRLMDNAKWVFLRDPDGNMIELCGHDPE